MIEAEKKNSYLESAQNYDFQKFTFDSTINELSNVDTEELIKDPKEVFDVFLKYLQESPDKLNKINKKKLEKIQMFISDQGNKDYVLSQYITYIKRFSSDNPKFDDKDKTVFSEIKSNIEKIYNWPDGNWIDIRQLEQKIFTPGFNYDDLLQLWKALNPLWIWANISLGEKIISYCEGLWVDLDNYLLFIEKFNFYNEQRISEIVEELAYLKPWMLCWLSLWDSEIALNQRYRILDQYDGNTSLQNPWMPQNEFLNKFWDLIRENLPKQSRFVNSHEFYKLIENDKNILLPWIHDLWEIVEEKTREQLVISDFVWEPFSSIEWKDIDTSVILSIIRRSPNQEKKNKITSLIKNKDITGLFNLIIGPKKKMIFDENFFNAMYDYLQVQNLEYGHMWELHNKINKEKIYLSLWTCDTQLKRLILNIISNSDNIDDIKKLQLKLVDIDLDPENINLDNILDIDWTIWIKTQQWIWNYIDTFCNVWDDIQELEYIMQEKINNWTILKISNTTIYWVNEWNLIQWVWIVWDEIVQVWKFNNQWKMEWLWVSISIDGTKEKWNYKNWVLDWDKWCRIYWNKNREEWIFKNWKLCDGVRYEVKLSKWYQIEKRWIFAEWKYLQQWTITFQNNKDNIIEEAWKFHGWNLTWPDCSRKYTDWSTEEWKFENWKFIEWKKSYEDWGTEEWKFENWKLVEWTRIAFEKWIKIIEIWTFNKLWELQWKTCSREKDWTKETWCFLKWEKVWDTMNDVVFDALQEALRIVDEDNPRYVFWADWSSWAYDCSHFVRTSYKKAIPWLKYASTSEMVSAYKKAWFKWYANSKKHYKQSDLKPWDILRRNGHTEIYYGPNKTIWAHSRADGVSLRDTADPYIQWFSWYLRYEWN